ncbi:MAG: ABC transporter substrate-binding protein [Bacilli bacterium]|nr:ABC transporter substrate-binding protein [Bacilli bacterium]
MKKKMFNKMFLCMSAIATLGAVSSCSQDARIKIGVLQYINIPALNQAFDGFKEVLEEELGEDAFTIELKDAAGDSTTNAAAASTLASKKCDLLFGIATPSALALQSEVARSMHPETPILFTAVTDPVASGLVLNPDVPEANITGTNDMNPVAEQIALFKTINPSITKVGVLYSSNEPNSIVQLNLAKAAGTANGIQIVSKAISSSNDIPTTIDALINSDKIEGLYVPTDNTISAAMGTVFSSCKEKKVPIVCGEANMLTSGGMFSLGVDYHNLGEVTGKMAVDILKHKKSISEIPSVGATEFPLSINKDLCDEMGITVPADLLASATLVSMEK